MHGALVIARNDLRRRVRDRSFVIQGLLAPILFAAIIGLAFGGGFDFKATIGVADADGSEASRGVVDALVNDAGGGPLTFVRVEPTAVDSKLGDGAIDAAIVFPAGFGQAVSTTQPVDLEVLFDANKRVTADVARAVADGISARFNAGRLAVATALFTGDQPPDEAAVQRLVQEARSVELPITVTLGEVQGRYSPVAYFAPSMAMLFLFFTLGAGARSLITERSDGTLSRMRAAPISDSSILLGKTGGVLVLGLASLLVVWAVTTFVFRASWGDPIAVMAVILATVFATAGISVLITGVARTDAQADGLVSMVAFALALLGGNFLSPGSLPPLFEKLSLFTPNGWALRSFTRIGSANAGVVDVLPAIGVLVGIGLITGTLGLAGLRKKVVS
ncbi:MAG: ABC transporter permease [Acidimicrobiales bacterium]